MSRLGNKPILIPKGVEAKFSKGLFEVKGPKGQYSVQTPNEIDVKIENDMVHVAFDDKGTLEKPMYGLYRSLINNAVVGVSVGFEKKLTLIGVGYRAALKGKDLELQLGYSNPCMIEIPETVKVAVEKSTAISITGVDKQLVGQFAADVRAFRPPEPYKGKGVRYENEFVRKKAGKAAKGG